MVSKFSVSYLGYIPDMNQGRVFMALKILGKLNYRIRYIARKAILLDRGSLRMVVWCPYLVQCHFDWTVLKEL